MTAAQLTAAVRARMLQDVGTDAAGLAALAVKVAALVNGALVDAGRVDYGNLKGVPAVFSQAKVGNWTGTQSQYDALTNDAKAPYNIFNIVP